MDDEPTNFAKEYVFKHGHAVPVPGGEPGGMVFTPKQLTLEETEAVVRAIIKKHCPPDEDTCESCRQERHDLCKDPECSCYCHIGVTVTENPTDAPLQK